MGKVERDATSLGATAPTMSPDLIIQVEEGTAAQEISYQEAITDTPF